MRPSAVGRDCLSGHLLLVAAGMQGRGTTLARILSGEAQPASGTITRKVGYLPHDPQTGDLDVPANI
ncbi:MAG TPA: hypothetical protein VJN19_07765 [Propionibacteriaceae bacterium]|nr:hypothetical protein [Propionibacteriaceae bacterium]